MIIKRYASEDKKVWDAFVEVSKNGTFLFKRDYMDYHHTRFTDHSLLFYNDKGKLIALLPANECNGVLYSHQGLTYGGLVMDKHCTALVVIECFECLLDYMRANSLKSALYKPVPHVYHRYPAEEDINAIFNVCKANLVKRNVSSCLPLANPYPLRQNRRTALNKARMEGIIVKESQDIASFWKILSDNLRSTYNSRPVHSLEEIQQLKASFPKEIRLLAAYKDEVMIGGILLYVMPDVLHTQYISATQEGKQLGAIDAIMYKIMSEEDKRYLDIGTSAGENGALINESLLFQKEGFGARAVCYDTYEWKV